MTSSIEERLTNIRKQLPEGVQLVAVSKFHPEEELMEAYRAGQRLFGENRVQELVRKQAALPKDIAWHMIGHLQRNKVKYIAPWVSLIQSVDSTELLHEIDRQGQRCGRRIPCLLEVKVAQEETKTGLTPEELFLLFHDVDVHTLQGAEIRGLMCMASLTDDEQRIETDFMRARTLFDEVKKLFFADDEQFALRSWGMSSDYATAIREGSNMVRIGTSIFGERHYPEITT